MTRLTCVAGVAVLLFACVFAFGQETQPSASTEHLRAKVTGVEGIVQVRTAEGQPWQKVTVGMEVGEDAEFRTGPKSAVRFTIPPDQTITLDRLGTVKMLQAVNDNGKLKTQLGMRYGRTRYDIEAAGREHESSISTPSSTLALRGTKVSVYDQRPFPAQAVSLTGRAEFRDFKKRVFFGGKGAGKTTVNVQNPNAAAVALGESTVDPGARLARSDAEEQLVNTLLSSGASVSFDYDKGIKVVRGGTVPTDAQLIPTLPGVLNFVARWHTNSDVNFSASTPGGPNGNGELIYPTGSLATNSSGGRTGFDHRGGPNGGIEVIFFPTVPQSGFYALGLTLISGPSTTAQVDAFLNGQRVGIFNGQGVVQTNTVDVTPPIPGFVDGTAAGIVPIGQQIPTASAMRVTTSTKPKRR